MSAGGDLEGNPFPEVLDPTTLLLLRFLCFLMFSTAERRLSNKKSKDWGVRPSSYSYSETSPFLPWLGHHRDTAPQDTAFVLPSSCASGQAARPSLGGPSGALGGTQGAKGGVGSSQSSPAVRLGPAPRGTLAEGGTVWGPGDLPWFLQLLLTHFSICSLLPQRVPIPHPPGPPGMLLQVPAGPVFFLGGGISSCWGDSILLQHGNHGFHGNLFCPNYFTTATAFNLPLIVVF